MSSSPSTSATRTFEETRRQLDAVELLGTDASHILLYGGSRSGKTIILLAAMVCRALKRRSRHLILRFRFNHCKTSIWHDSLPAVLEMIAPRLPVQWDRGDFFVRFPNGSEVWIGGLDEKQRTEKVLGTQYSTIFFNECSQIAYPSVEMARTRLAENSGLANKAYYDCNPPNRKHWAHLQFIEKRDPMTKALLEHPDAYASMLMNPEDNRANLPDGYIETFLDTLSRRNRDRFRDGKWLDVSAGALWSEEMIQRKDAPPQADRIVIGVDPAASSGPDAEAKNVETGIIVAQRSGNDLIVLDDLSGTYTPAQWGQHAIEAFHAWRANLIVGERNNGGDMVEDVIRVRAANVAYKSVWASHGKSRRAEPIADLYEQGRGYHVGVFPELEDQMCSWVQGATVKEMGFSPDRMDALVWAATELFLGEAPPQEPRVVIADHYEQISPY